MADPGPSRPAPNSLSGTLLNGWGSRLSPNKLLVILAAATFVAEICAMLLLSSLPPLSKWVEALVDSCILLLLLSPTYFCLYRPFWRDRLRAEEQIRKLSRQQIRAEESIRKTLARDLHDEFGQTLGALQFGIETLKNTLPAGANGLAGQCERLSRMTAELGEHVRDVTAQLRPTMLDNLGLVATLRWHLEQFQLLHHEVRVIMDLPEVEPGLPAETSLVLYRVCQESLNNVAKHARASVVKVSLIILAREVMIEIEDDGRGIAPLKVEDEAGSYGGGIGLLGMRERVADQGGEITVSSQKGSGTRIRAVLPWRIL